MEISVAVVPEREITEWDEYTGRLEAKDSVEIRPQITGQLLRIQFTEGKEVKQGDLLFLIDPRPFQAELDHALAQVEQARAAMELAKADLARGDKLLATRAVSQEEYDQRTATARTSDAQLKSAEAAVQTARLNLAYTRITSPINGRVGRAEVTQGNLVSPTSKLTTVVSLEPMYAYFDAAEQDYLKYNDLARSGARPSSREVKNPVQMALGNETDFKHAGYMDFVDNKVNGSTGTLTGRAVFENKDHYLVPGMFVRVRLIGSGKYKGVLINDRAIATDQDRQYVLIVAEGGKVEYRAITTGPVVDGLRVVRGGVKAGEQIIVNGLQRVRPGMVVKPRIVPMEGEAPAAAAAAPAAGNGG
ncbi:MAG TPA: efflux RND transporter periplasmic adaptor subunit [Steroidobacteraceae bacterium]|nr:efflux RND transporter periplasmic adaptor subunit [Steroidobacteraceae bacterium]